MSVEKIGSLRPVGPVRNNTAGADKNKEASEGKDTVQLSDEAKMLFAAEKAKRVGNIRAKVRNGFYDSPEVTERVVEGLLRDIKTLPQA